MANDDHSISKGSSATQIDTFLRKVASTPLVKAARQQGRLIFALDATASRQPTWDQASGLQAQMFSEAAALGGLQLQLCYYRGYNEFSATAWIADGDKLLDRMTGVFCRAGTTQIARVLQHAVTQARQQPVQGVIFVGDCMEEDADRLYRLAGELRLLNAPLFVFHEGHDAIAEKTFQHIAELSGGACCPFDINSPGQLRDLLRAVAVYAAGGRKALQQFGHAAGTDVLRLVHQLDRK
jgi:hypothetical protein